MRRPWLIGLFVACVTVPVLSQTVAMVVPGGPTLPATCTVRSIFFKTGSDPGLYSCDVTDTWTGPLGVGGSGSVAWADLTGVPAPVTALTGTNTGDQNLWASVIVAGQTTLTTASPTQALTIVEGANITLTTDNTAKTLTITGSGTSGAPTDAQYWVGAANGSLSAEKDLSALATALVLNTAGTPSAYGGIDCTNQFVRDVASTGAGTCASVAIGADVSGLGTGIATALGVNTGSAGAPVLFNGAGGTPSSLTLTNATGLPVGGLTGLGTGVGTALGIAVGTAGGPVVLNGAGGTPSSITLTSATGLPLSTGITGDLPFSNLTQAAAASRLLGRGSASGAGDYEEITVGTGLSMSGTTLTATATAPAYNITFVIDGGGAVITTGFKGCTTAQQAGTIVSATVLSTDASVTAGTLIVDVWEDTLNAYPPTDADSITSSTPPTLSGPATNSFDSTLTSWQKTLVNGGSAATTSVLCFNVDPTPTVVTRAAVIIRVQP